MADLKFPNNFIATYQELLEELGAHDDTESQEYITKKAELLALHEKIDKYYHYYVDAYKLGATREELDKVGNAASMFKKVLGMLRQN